MKGWFAIKWKEKGWLQALGLHHGSITAGVILAFHLIGLGWYAAAFMPGWYLQREWGNKIFPRKPFEILDFATSLFVGLIYLYFWN